MAQILSAGSLNIPALVADDAYIQIVAPPNFITGVPTDVIGVVGTASWGPVNVPQLLGSGQQAVQTFGQISAASLTDTHDIATDLYLAFGQAASQASLQGWAVRVSDGTDAAAAATISSATSATPATATITGSLTVGDGLQLIATTTGLAPNSPVTVTYTTVAGDTVTSMATGLAAAVNANTVLSAAGVFASSSLGVVSMFWPTTISPTIVWTRNVTGSATETITIGAGSPGVGGVTLTSLYTGVLGNQITVRIAASTASANSFDVTITPPVGLPEIYRGIPLAQFWRTLTSCINLGQSSVRGASSTLRAASTNPAVGAPTAATTTLSGGTDGRAGVTTAMMIGSQTVSPPTGMWSLNSLFPSVGIMWLSGVTDVVAPASMLTFNLTAGCSSVFSLATALSVTTAVTTAQSTAVADPSMVFLKDWIYFFDTINNQQRLVPSSPVVGGKWATLTPEQSPGNKPVSLVIGTERNSPQIGNQPYTLADIAALEGAGIITITNPIPRGRVFGMRHGLSSSLSAVTAPAEYWRLTMYLARSAATIMGQYVDELQSQQDDDPLRAGFKLQSNTFLQLLKGFGQIDNFLVTCTLSKAQNAMPGLGVNTPSSIAQHYMFALWQVTYLSSVRFFVLSLQGGTTVVEVAGQLTQQTATL